MRLWMSRYDQDIKRTLAKACSRGPDSLGFDVWLHVYDLGLLSKWLLNDWSSSESGIGAFHCGVEVMGVEWSFQAMVAAEDDTTGMLCHAPKLHPRHLYRESICLGTSPLSANEIYNVLIGLETSWLANSYHFLTHNCTDFAEALSQSLHVPTPFPTWAHGLAKANPTATSWLPSSLGDFCCSCSFPSEIEADARLSCSTTARSGCEDALRSLHPGCSLG